MAYWEGLKSHTVYRDYRVFNMQERIEMQSGNVSSSFEEVGILEEITSVVIVF